MPTRTDCLAIDSISNCPPPIVIMQTRPTFAPLPSLLELCEALAFAGAQCVGMGVWAAGEALLTSGVAWAWAVQGLNMQREMRTAFDSLLQCMLVMMCQCNLHQLACSSSFVTWSKEALAASALGDTTQVSCR